MEATIIKKTMKPMSIVCSDKTNNTRLKLTDKKLIILQIKSKYRASSGIDNSTNSVGPSASA
jgi:hypothetical protein